MATALFVDDHAAAVPLLTTRHRHPRRRHHRFRGSAVVARNRMLGGGRARRRRGAVPPRTSLGADGPCPRSGRPVVTIGLMFLGLAELFAGDLSAARMHLAERVELMEAIGRPIRRRSAREAGLVWTRARDPCGSGGGDVSRDDHAARLDAPVRGVRADRARARTRATTRRAFDAAASTTTRTRSSALPRSPT